MALSPSKLTVRAYNVGFGDALLLIFEYDGKAHKRHVLIDCGSVQKPEDAKGSRILAVAQHIAETTGGTLDAIVVTHRHADHISGFARSPKGNGPGDIIRALKPRLIVQPWTEKPGAKSDWKGPTEPSSGDRSQAFLDTLRNVHVVSSIVMAEARNSRARFELMGAAAENQSDPNASRNLQSMTGKHKYVFYGESSGLEPILPGVKVAVLGPPTAAQSAFITGAYAKESSEYWNFCQSWFAMSQGIRRIGKAAENGKLVIRPLFPKFAHCRWMEAPVDVRWFIARVRQVRDDQLRSLVHTMDGVLNNTSVILLMEVGGRKLLFPGDAQWENWSYALSKTRQPALGKNPKKNNPVLNDVDLYKVGHHGSLNATPRSVWDAFGKRSTRKAGNRLTTLMSTRSNSKYGDADRGTEVPRRKLVNALKRESTLRTTQELDGKDGLFIEVVFDLQTSATRR
jgi:hypothetical protein